jgi:hypothetical protein
VRGSPRDGALVDHLGGDLFEVLPVLRGVPLEVVSVLLAVGVVVGDWFRAHGLLLAPGP